MNSKNTITTYNKLDFSNQESIGEENPKLKEARMTLKTLVASILLSSSLFVASEVQARQNMTDEQLAKARETASQMNPPVNFDALLDEADRLGVECKGDLTRRVMLKICATGVDTAQSEERQAELDRENQKLEEELRIQANNIADMAQRKLDEIEEEESK